MRLLDCFDRRYVINLRSRPDRLRDFQRQLHQIGHEPADVEVLPGVEVAAAEGFETPGARGCFLSHLAVIEQACNDAVASVLILEDDVNFVTTYRTFEPQNVEYLQSNDWSFFYGDYKLLGPTREVGGNIIEVPFSSAVELGSFIAIRGHCLPDLSAFLRQLLVPTLAAKKNPFGPMHVDGAYSTFRRLTPCAKTYAADPKLGYQRSSVSNIAIPTGLDRVAALNGFMRILRRAKNVVIADDK